MLLIFALDSFLLSFRPLCSGTPDDLRRALDLLADAGVAATSAPVSATSSFVPFSVAVSAGFSSSVGALASVSSVI